jgi:amino-acid N-acetyltransferase
MDAHPTLEPASPSDLGPIRRLLDDSGLPSADVAEHLAGFLVVRAGPVLAGVVGVEPHGTEALLRSLCVVADRRGSGLASALCAGAETIARGTGARELYLLTTDARSYFEKRGFAVRRREDAAPAIQGTAEFQTLCPSTATVMSKPLSDASARFLPRSMLPLRPDGPGARMWAVALEQVLMTYFEVDPGTRFERHQHEGEQITSVIEGELLFEIDGAVVRVGPGEAIAIPPGTPHAVFTVDRAAKAFDSWSQPFPTARRAP